MIQHDCLLDWVGLLGQTGGSGLDRGRGWAVVSEPRLDPIPDFLPAVSTHLAMRDTRGEVFGFLPFAPEPGGGEGEEARGLLDRQTIRRTFEPVPYYNPAIIVGADGQGEG